MFPFVKRADRQTHPSLTQHDRGHLPAQQFPALRHRKNSLFYKTLAGARVGDIHMSLIHTCALNKVNPFDYLMALDQHAEAVTKEPAGWFPWNYRQALEAANST